MKIKGLRWWVIGLIMLITIINYLDRGTLNYMWVANIEYKLVDEFSDGRENEAILVIERNEYQLKTRRSRKHRSPKRAQRCP